MRTLIVITLALLIFSCHQEKIKSDLAVIDLENNVGKSRKVVLSEVAESIEYIPFETTEESILGIPVMGGLIYENGKFFIFQKGNYLKIFNSSGKYLSLFNKQGKGPKEYMSLYNVSINSCAKVISIRSAEKIVEYSVSGEYLRTINLPDEKSLQDVHYTGYSKIGYNYYILSTSIESHRSNLNYSAFLFDSTSKVLIKIPYPKEEKEFVIKLDLKGSASNQISPLLFKYKDCVRIINGTNENVVSINKDLQVDTVFRFNYGKYNVKNYPESYNLRIDEQPFLQIHYKIFESSSFLFMRFKTGKLPFKPWEFKTKFGKIGSSPISCSIFNKKTGQFSFIDQCGVDEFGLIDDFEGGPAFWPLYISQDDYMVSYIDALKFIEYAQTHKVSDKFKKIADSLNENSNPVVVLVKLKE